MWKLREEVLSGLGSLLFWMGGGGEVACKISIVLNLSFEKRERENLGMVFILIS